MTTVSSIDQIFTEIGDEIEKFPVNHMTFPTYHELVNYDNDTLKSKIMKYRDSRFTGSLSPISISTTYPTIVTEVQAIIEAYNKPSLPQTPSLSTDIIKKLITDILIHYDYTDDSVKKELKDYTFDALFPKLNKSSTSKSRRYSNHIKENDSFDRKNIKLGHLYQYINVEGERPLVNTESKIILGVLNKQPQPQPQQQQPNSVPLPPPKPQSQQQQQQQPIRQLRTRLQSQPQPQLRVQSLQQSQPRPQIKLFNFLFYTDTDTKLSFILSTVKPENITNITFDIIKNAIINYLATYEYFYKVYLHTKTTNSLFFQVIDKKQEKLNKYETQFTYTQQLTDNFFAITAYNNNGKKVEGQRVHIAITNDYLNYKFCLGNNNSSSGFVNINHPYPLRQPSSSTFTLNEPTISTYNLNERAFKYSFNYFIENLIDLMKTSTNNVKTWIEQTPINCFQEVNINSFKESIKSITSPEKKKVRPGGGIDSPDDEIRPKRKRSNPQAAQAAQSPAQAQAAQPQAAQAAQAAEQSFVNVIIDKELKKYKDSTNIKKFIETNNIKDDNGTYSIPVYKNIFKKKNGVLISNRLANFNTDEEIKKGNLTCIDNEIKKDHIFIGKIGSGYQNNNIHTFIAIKQYLDPVKEEKYNIIINLHLDTDDSKRIKQLELIYLLKYIIPKYSFFKDVNVEKIYIIGDLNMDCYEIITSIRERVNNIYYKDRRFKIVLNNIITQVSMNTKDSKDGKGSALDNCIIIEKIPNQPGQSNQPGRSKCGEYKPQIYISESAKMPMPPPPIKPPPKSELKLSDHSLIIIQDTTSGVVSTNPSGVSKSPEISKVASRALSSSKSK
tara:strand:- start:3630 stop:6143 length:2514 start_codon:yes stop_codon:yes gene_type:complete